MRVTSSSLVLQQNSRAEQIEGIRVRLVEKEIVTLNQDIIRSRLDSVNRIWDEARVTHLELLTRQDAQSNAYLNDETYTVMESEYEKTHDVIVSLLHRVNAPSVDGNTPSRTEVEDVDTYERAAKLPKLDLPTFSGTHEDWENFCDLFTSLVHNSTRLSDASKLQYLKSCLRGSASDLVKDVTITNANYSSTWRALKARYFNSCLIVNNYINSLLELPYIQTESAVELRALIDKAQCVVRALGNLGLPVEHWNIWLVHILSKRLDPESRKLWEAEVSFRVRKSTAIVANTPNVEPSILDYFKTYADFIEFLEQRAQALTMIQTDPKINTNRPSTSKPSTPSKRTFHVNTMQNNNSKVRKCPFCSEQHYIWSCTRFRNKSPHERRDIIRRLKLCFNCLNPHEIQNCQYKRNCIKCNSRHNTLLHNDTPDKATAFVQKGHDGIETNKNTEPETSVTTLTANLRSPKRLILLATAQIIVCGPDGNQCRIRALLDQGSEASFVSESIVQLLGMKKRGVKIPISGLGASGVGFAKSIVHFSLHSIYDSNQIFEIEALVLPRLTSCLPSSKPLDLDFSQFEGYQLADPGFFEPESVNVILAADIYSQLLKPRLQRFHSSQLIGQDTALGLIISGPIQEKTSVRLVDDLQTPIINAHCAVDDNLDKQLQKFWEIEELSSVKSILKPEDEACEKFFQDTCTRDPDGRFVVRLPFKSEPPLLAAETRSMALKSLRYTHTKFLRDSKLAEAYQDFMNTYMILNHMEKVSPEDLHNPRAWYLPHHAIMQNSQQKSKIRVVFDASRRTQVQHGLNNFLMSGAPLQNDLALILLSWRKYRYVFTADIVKMFRQIRVHAYDQDLQRILWSPSTNIPPVDYRLKTVTYGTACAPFLAMRTLTQLISNEQARFPLGSACLQKNTYVDDIFAGDDDILVAKLKRDELIKLLRSAGIELNKWSTNKPDLLPDCLHTNETEISKSINLDESVKTLGINWTPTNDVFTFQVSELCLTLAITKRTVLAAISKLFDPLGWLAPITIVAKILMQDLWILKYNWDTPLPAEARERWENFRNSLIIG